MLTAQQKCAPLRARHPIARSGAGHRATSMRATGSTLLLGTWCTRLMAELVAPRVTAPNLTGPFAGATIGLAVTSPLASMWACRVLPTTNLLADSVVGSSDLAFFAYIASMARTAACVTTRQHPSTCSRAVEVGAVDSDMAWKIDCVIAAGNFPRHLHVAPDRLWSLGLPATS